MQIVQPIRDRKKIKALAVQLKEKNDKYFIMFDIGVNVGLRISDILKLKVEDVYMQDHVTIFEQKTGKYKRFLINKKVAADIRAFVENHHLNPEDYMITSRKRDENGNHRPISRVQAYRVLAECADLVGLDEIGTHSLRKTFGYWHYKQHHDVALLQELFNHSSPYITLIYIGINQDIKDESMENFYLL